MSSNRWSLVWGVAALAACAATGCNKGATGGTAAGGSASAAATGASDPVIDLAKPVVATCKFDEYGNFDSDCAPYKAWEDSKAFDEGKADASLVKMLENSDEKLRRLAADKLCYNARAMREDKDLATRVVSAVEKETSSKVLQRSLGCTVGGIKIDKAPLFDRISALAKGTKDLSFRTAIVETFIGANPTSDPVWAFQKDEIKAAEPKIRLAAIRAFWGNPFNMKPKETCEVYKENFGNADPAVASIAVSHSSGSKHCLPNLDAAYDEVEKRVNAHNVPEDSAFDLFNTLRDTWGDQGTSDKQKKRRLAIAERAALDTKLPARSRMSALQAVKDDDPKGLKAFAGKLQHDKDKGLSELAKSFTSDKK